MPPMIKDRFAELQNVAGNNPPPPYQNQGHVNETALANEIDPFFEKINEIKTNSDQMIAKTNDLNIMHNALINPSVDDNENDMRRRADETNAEIQTLATRTNNKLKQMKMQLDKNQKEIEEAERNGKAGEAADGTTRAMARAHKSHYNAVTRKFKESMEDYQREQINYKEKLKNRLKKQLQVVDENWVRLKRKSFIKIVDTFQVKNKKMFFFLDPLFYRQFDDDKLDEMIETGNMEVFDQGFLQIGSGFLFKRILKVIFCA